MDLGTIIITFIFIAIVTIPFVLTGYSKKRKKKNLLRKLTEIAGNEGGTISQHEFCSNFVIGLDEMANHLYFYKKGENMEIAKSINLREFKICRLLNTNRTIGEKKSSYSVIDKLELCFYPNDKNRPDESLEIYNDEYDSLTLSGELQLAEKWEKLLNERMKKLQKSKTGIDILPSKTVSKPVKQITKKPAVA
ncbi:hypothetical protein [Mariniphaga sp.]|uniref:hypothetical protein n=1 Tax=Mariniphaga sp. TaxID=1954475 RepID=UPI00356734D8